MILREGSIVFSAVMLDESGFVLTMVWRLETVMHENPGVKWFSRDTEPLGDHCGFSFCCLDTCICRFAASLSLAEINSVSVVGLTTFLYVAIVTYRLTPKQTDTQV